MEKVPLGLNWSYLQSFAMVAETGSLSAAAQRLGLSQPTLGRHLKALEEDLGVTLFIRQPRGLMLTNAGLQLMPAAQAMQVAAGRLALSAAGESPIWKARFGSPLRTSFPSMSCPGSSPPSAAPSPRSRSSWCPPIKAGTCSFAKQTSPFECTAPINST